MPQRASIVLKQQSPCQLFFASRSPFAVQFFAFNFPHAACLSSLIPTLTSCGFGVVIMVMESAILDQIKRWAPLLCFLLSLQRGSAQFVELTAEVEIFYWSSKPE